MSLDPGYFDAMYSGTPDPWGFQDRWYERRKRDLLLASLPRARFRSAFEPGCSIGVLTEALAGRCDRLLATDVSAVPLEVARRRLRDRPHVEFARAAIPADWPAGPFDLVVLSELVYYCDDADLDRVSEVAGASLTGDGVLVACHWRHPVADYPQTGDHVHAVLRARSGLERLGGYEDADLLLDVLVRPPARSVAAAEGLT